MAELPAGQRKPYGRPGDFIGDGSSRAVEGWLAQVWRLTGREIDRLSDLEIMRRYRVGWEEKFEPPAGQPTQGVSVVEWEKQRLMREEGLTDAQAVAELKRRREKLLAKKPKSVKREK